MAKTVVITGAGSGFGRALAVAWARRGWRTGIVDIDMEGAEETLRMVGKAGGAGETYRCDVRKKEEVEAMADHFFEAWGKVGVLVNNAGVYSVGCAEDVALEDWERVMEINLWGVIYGCRDFIPRMKRQGGGHIVNMGSAAGLMNLPEMSPYNIVKAGVISLSETLKAELAPYGIGITVACPSYFNTDLASTMTTTNEFQNAFANASFSSSRTSADRIAEKVLEAVERNKLCVVPQFHVKLAWLLKRSLPSVWFSVVQRIFGTNRSKRVLLWFARRGMI